MAVYYYGGGFPYGFKAWWHGDKSKPLLDPDTTEVALFYKGRVRVRNIYGLWANLGTNHYTGGDYFSWVELQSSNPDYLSNRTLDRIFDGIMPPEEQEYVIMPHAEKYRQIEALARRQQSQWAKAVKAMARGRCYVTGSMLALEAAHVKPFCICSAKDAVDVENGVCLTASVHTLFDSISAISEVPKDDPLYKLMDIKKLAQLIARRDKMNGHK